MGRYKFITSLAAVITFSIFLAACGSAKVESAKGEGPEREPAMDFTLKDLKGNSFSLSTFFGKRIVLLDFGATWCPYCVDAIPTLKAIHAGYKDVKVVAVDIKESRQVVEQFAEKHKLPYTIVLDTDGAVASIYEVRGIPTVIVVDKKGIIRYKGHHISEEIIKDIVNG